MPTSARIALSDAWLQIATAGPCIIENTGFGPVMLSASAAAPAVNDGHLLYHHGQSFTVFNHTTTEPLWARAAQRRADGTMLYAEVVATGANVVAPSGAPVPPAAAVTTWFGSKKMLPGDAPITFATLKALVPSGKLMSVEVAAVDGLDGKADGTILIGTAQLPMRDGAVRRFGPDGNYPLDDTLVITIAPDADGSLEIIFSGPSA